MDQSDRSRDGIKYINLLDFLTNDDINLMKKYFRLLET